MKKLILLFAIVSTSSISVSAKKVEGYFINNNNRKVTVVFLVPFGIGSGPTFERIQEKITYIKDDREEVLYPEDAREIIFTYKDKTYRMISIYDNIGLSKRNQSSDLFLCVEIDGQMRLLHYYASSQTVPTGPNGLGVGIIGGGECHLLQNGGGYLVKLRDLFLKKDLIEAFDDCPEIIEKVKSTEFPDVEKMVKLYNEKCK